MDIYILSVTRCWECYQYVGFWTAIGTKFQPFGTPKKCQESGNFYIWCSRKIGMCALKQFPTCKNTVFQGTYLKACQGKTFWEIPHPKDVGGKLREFHLWAWELLCFGSSHAAVEDTGRGRQI